jgi:hypothetical protein
MINGGANRIVMSWVSFASAPRCPRPSAACRPDRTAGSRSTPARSPTVRTSVIPLPPSRGSSRLRSRSPRTRAFLELPGLQEAYHRMTNRDRRRIAAEGRPVAARSDHAQNVVPPFLIKAGPAAPRRRVDPAASARVGRATCRPFPTRRAAGGCTASSRSRCSIPSPHRASPLTRFSSTTVHPETWTPAALRPAPYRLQAAPSARRVFPAARSFLRP